MNYQKKLPIRVHCVKKLDYSEQFILASEYFDIQIFRSSLRDLTDTRQKKELTTRQKWTFWGTSPRDNFNAIAL